MKTYIKTNIDEFIIERYKLNNLPPNVILLSKSTKNSHVFLLYNVDSKKPIGYISFALWPTIKSYTVGGAYSERGYGPFLYECAMTFVYPSGLSMSRDSNTSGDALNIWFKFKERDDVKNERIYSDEITHKKEDWIASGLFDDDPKYRQSIFNLEDTRFYYSFGKEKLNKLINEGKEYMKENNISEQDVECMSWDLE